MPAAAAVRATARPGLDLLTASADLVHADLDLAPLRRREERLAEAPAAGRSIFDFDPRATGAHAYRLAAVELAERAGVSAAAESAAAPPPAPAPPAEPVPSP